MLLDSTKQAVHLSLPTRSILCQQRRNLIPEVPDQAPQTVQPLPGLFGCPLGPDKNGFSTFCYQRRDGTDIGVNPFGCTLQEVMSRTSL